ncbi:MAG: hypothetical protein U0104_02440 [Gemmatimonadales bacterium]
MSEPVPASRLTTAIPPRYAASRDRVLRILGRWEATTRLAMSVPAWTVAGTEQPCGS